MKMKESWNKLLESNDPVTPQQISDFEHYKRLSREKITLWNKPMKTFYVFLSGLAYLIKKIIFYLASSKKNLVLFLISLLLCYILVDFPGPYSLFVSRIVFNLEYVVWWVGLGVLSSIGLGSGLQSGVLFLFPHIFKTCLTAQSCGTLNFDSAGDMWFRSSSSLFKCPSEPTNLSEPVSLIGIWKKVIVVCLLQSAGTAIGEIPPYWMTRAARLAAIEAGSDLMEAMPHELEMNSRYTIINKAKTILVWFLEKYGFWGVLIMASYPNIAFDLCGVCCGHFLMPFWTFFIATLIGKVIIRNSYQSILYVMLCSEDHLETLIGHLQYFVPNSFAYHLIRNTLEESKMKFRSKLIFSNDSNLSPDVSADNIAFWWHIFTSTLLILFFLSCITHFAQYFQLILDKKESSKLRKRLPHATRLELSSPSTGKLKLPPPTPHVKCELNEDGKES